MRLEFQVHSFRIILLKDLFSQIDKCNLSYFPLFINSFHSFDILNLFFVVSLFLQKPKPIPIQPNLPSSHPPLPTRNSPPSKKHQLARWQVTKLDVSLNTLELIPSNISNLVDCEIFLAYSNQLKEAAFVFFSFGEELRKAYEFS